jgi:hypothetical protein
MSIMQQRKIHQSENGDSWWLCREESNVSFYMRPTFLLEGRRQGLSFQNFSKVGISRQKNKRFSK